MSNPTRFYDDEEHRKFTRVPAPSTHATQDRAQAHRTLLLGAIVFAGGALMAAMILVRMIQ